MPSPLDAARVVTNMTATRPSTINLPAGIVAGDLLVIAARGGGAVTNLLPSGWSWLVQNDQTDASDDTVSIIYKKADGSEGATLTWDLGFAIKGCTIAWRIVGAVDPATQAPEVVGANFTTVANTADPPASTPTGGSKDYLFLAIAGKDGIQAFTAAPAGYTNFIAGSGSTGGQAATNATAAGASKQATAATENPGVFTHGVAVNGGRAFTIAIHPGTPPAPDDETTLDDFNRADGQLNAGAGAAIWTQTAYDSSTPSDLRIAANQLRGIATWQSAITKFKLQANFDLLVDCVVPPAAPNLEFGLYFSMTDEGTSGYDTYALFWSGSTWFIRRYANGVNQGNIVSVPGPLLAGDTIWVRKRGSDIKIYRRPSGGQYGVFISITEATLGAGVVVIELSDVTQRWDNLRGGPKVVSQTLYGAISLPVTFGKEVSGRRKTFSQLSFPMIFNKDVRGQRKAFGQISLPLVFGKDIAGRKTAFGKIVFPINVFINTIGTILKPTIYGSFSLPIIFGKNVQGSRRVRGKIALPMYVAINVNSGHIEAHGQLIFPIIFDKSVAGKQKGGAIILNEATNIYLGTHPVAAVYIDGQKVWPIP